MKKVILSISIIAMVAIFALSLTACNNATPQGQLQNLLNDHNHEEFTYDVFAVSAQTGERFADNTNYNGTYVVKLDAYDAGSTIADFGNGELQSVSKGVLVTGVLNVGEGDNQTVYKTGCYFNLIDGSSYMVPYASYRVQTVGGVEKFKLQGSYDGKNYNYERWIDGVQSSGNVEFKATSYYDNNEFHQSLRTLSTFSDSMSFSFSVPLVSAFEATTVNLTASVTDRSVQGGIECYKTVISRSTEVAGMSQVLYYSVNDVKYNGWGLKHVLVRIEEPFKMGEDVYNMVYQLKEDGAKLS